MLCCCLCHRVAGTPRDLLRDVFRTQILPASQWEPIYHASSSVFSSDCCQCKIAKGYRVQTLWRNFGKLLHLKILESLMEMWKKVRVLDFFAQTPPCWEFLLIFSLQNLPNIFFVTFDKILCCFSFTITLWANRQDLRGLWSTETLKKVFTWHSSAATMLVSNIRILSSWNIFSYFWYWNEKEIDYGFDNDAYDDDDDAADDANLHVTVLLLEHGALPLGRQQEGQEPRHGKAGHEFVVFLSDPSPIIGNACQ